MHKMKYNNNAEYELPRIKSITFITNIIAKTSLSYSEHNVQFTIFKKQCIYFLLLSHKTRFTCRLVLFENCLILFRFSRSYEILIARIVNENFFLSYTFKDVNNCRPKIELKFKIG